MVENCIIDKHTVIGKNAKVGFGNDLTPNKEQPDLLESGITVLGKHLLIPEGMTIGRNVRVFQGSDFSKIPGNKIDSGETIR